MHPVKIMVQRLKKKAVVSSGSCVPPFRHYCAIKLLEEGANPNSVRLLLGHETLNMVLHYTKFVRVNYALTEHQQFNPLDKLYRWQDEKSSRNDWG
jgi:site-specific recombinase XerD